MQLQRHLRKSSQMGTFLGKFSTNTNSRMTLISSPKTGQLFAQIINLSVTHMMYPFHIKLYHGTVEISTNYSLIEMRSHHTLSLRKGFGSKRSLVRLKSPLMLIRGCKLIYHYPFWSSLSWNYALVESYAESDCNFFVTFITLVTFEIMFPNFEVIVC